MEELVRAGDSGADSHFGQYRQKTIPPTRILLEVPSGSWILRLLSLLLLEVRGEHRHSFMFSLKRGQGPGLLGDLTVWLLIDLFRVGQKKTWAFPDPQTV